MKLFLRPKFSIALITYLILVTSSVEWVLSASTGQDVGKNAKHGDRFPLHRMGKHKKQIPRSKSTLGVKIGSNDSSSGKIMNSQLSPVTPVSYLPWTRDQGTWNPIPSRKPFNPQPRQNYFEPETGSNQLVPYQTLEESSYFPVWSPYSYQGPNDYRRDTYSTPTGSGTGTAMALKKCDGKMNLIDDFGIVSLILSIFSTFVGFGLDLVLSFKGGALAIISKFFGLIFSLPSSFLTAINWTNPVTYLLSNGLNVLSIATTLFGAGGGVSIGNLGLATDIIFEILGIYGLILSVFSTFPTLFDEVVDAAELFGWGTEVKGFIDGYGCQNPYLDPTN